MYIISIKLKRNSEINYIHVYNTYINPCFNLISYQRLHMDLSKNGINAYLTMNSIRTTNIILNALSHNMVKYNFVTLIHYPKML
jgi:hypothetical protein